MDPVDIGRDETEAWSMVTWCFQTLVVVGGVNKMYFRLGYRPYFLGGAESLRNPMERQITA